MNESKLARSLVAVELESVLEDAVTQSELLVLETLLVLINLLLLFFRVIEMQEALPIFLVLYGYSGYDLRFHLDFLTKQKSRRFLITACFFVGACYSPLIQIAISPPKMQNKIIF